MFVIDRIELIALYKPHEVREFHRNHPVRLKENLHPSDKIVEVWDLGQDIVSYNEISLTLFCTELMRRRRTEEGDYRGDPLGEGSLSYIGGGFDSQGKNPSLNEVLEQIAIVACNLNDMAMATKAKALHNHVRVSLRVLQPRVRVRREVCVLDEDILWTHVRFELNQETVLTDVNVEWVESLHVVELVRFHMTLAGR